MKTKANDPIHHQLGMEKTKEGLEIITELSGLTKREYFAAMVGILNNPNIVSALNKINSILSEKNKDKFTISRIAKIMADALIDELNKIAVEEYKVVDEKGITQFVGSYTECYYVLFPNAEREWMDKEKFDEVYKDD